jgi:hypothetical protein
MALKILTRIDVVKKAWKGEQFILIYIEEGSLNSIPENLSQRAAKTKAT